jgi:hypothetical protein
MDYINSLSRVLLLAAVLVGPVAAADSVLSGTWQHVEPASAAGPARQMFLELHFASDGSFETRMRTSVSQPSGSFIIASGHYWQTGVNSYVAAADETMVCAGPETCRPFSEGAPALALGLGTVSTVHLERVGNLELMVNGQRWVRVR